VIRPSVLLALPLLMAVSHAAPPAHRATAGLTEETRKLPGFGDVSVYRPTDLAAAHGVVLFVSGDGGWNLGVVDMARRLAPHAIVAGLSMPAWQKRAEKNPDACWYPAGELEVAAQALEKLYAIPRYVPPILVGYSSGATVVYGALAQAPPTTFRGAVSLGFCPDLEVKRPFCGSKGWSPGWDVKKKQSWLPEYARMTERDGGGTKWIALQGLIDQVCAPPQTVEFVGRVPHSKVISLEKVGHGFSVPSRWGHAFDTAVGEMLESHGVLDPQPHVVRQDEVHRSPDEVAAKFEGLDLPLEVVWPAAPRAAVIFVSGDGGWAELDQSVARGLAAQGIAVVGWNTLRYFWLAKTPKKFADDLGRLMNAIPDGLAVFAGGYSFGAEAVPVVVAQAPAGSTLARLAGLVLLAPGPYASFEVSPLDWIRSDAQPTDHSVVKALDAMGSLPVICLEPKGSGESGCAIAARRGFERDELPGGHHFGGDYESLASRIAAFVAANSPR
jgi:type IV secretory pathway VirJ component